MERQNVMTDIVFVRKRALGRRLPTSYFEDEAGHVRMRLEIQMFCVAIFQSRGRAITSFFLQCHSPCSWRSC